MHVTPTRIPNIVRCLEARDRPKFGFGFGYGAESGDIFSFGYGRNREARFQPNFGYRRNYDKVSA